MKQTTTATVLADNTANVPTTLVSYLQRLKALDETSASVSDKVHSEVETFVLRALETTKTNQTTGKDGNNNNNINNKKRKLNKTTTIQTKRAGRKRKNFSRNASTRA